MYWKERLPTKEMLRRAIREGVVADGHKIAGFVYFKKIEPGMADVTLRVDLVDAVTTQPFDRIEIPLVLASGP